MIIRILAILLLFVLVCAPTLPQQLRVREGTKVDTAAYYLVRVDTTYDTWIEESAIIEVYKLKNSR